MLVDTRAAAIRTRRPGHCARVISNDNRIASIARPACAAQLEWSIRKCGFAVCGLRSCRRIKKVGNIAMRFAARIRPEFILNTEVGVMRLDSEGFSRRSSKRPRTPRETSFGFQFPLPLHGPACTIRRVAVTLPVRSMNKRRYRRKECSGDAIIFVVNVASRMIQCRTYFPYERVLFQIVLLRGGRSPKDNGSSCPRCVPLDPA